MSYDLKVGGSKPLAIGWGYSLVSNKYARATRPSSSKRLGIRAASKLSVTDIRRGGLFPTLPRSYNY